MTTTRNDWLILIGAVVIALLIPLAPYVALNNRLEAEHNRVLRTACADANEVRVGVEHFAADISDQIEESLRVLKASPDLSAQQKDSIEGLIRSIKNMAKTAKRSLPERDCADM